MKPDGLSRVFWMKVFFTIESTYLKLSKELIITTTIFLVHSLGDSQNLTTATNTPQWTLFFLPWQKYNFSYRKMRGDPSYKFRAEEGLLAPNKNTALKEFVWYPPKIQARESFLNLLFNIY